MSKRGECKLNDQLTSVNVKYLCVSNSACGVDVNDIFTFTHPLVQSVWCVSGK